MSKISFFYEDTLFKVKDKKAIRQWVKTICQNNNLKIVNLNYIFCNDQYLLAINNEFLSHDFFTDIITFDLRTNFSAENNNIEADIFISVERVSENAAENKVVFENELCRVMIHGILHLTGMKDKTISEKSKMRIEENACLQLLQTSTNKKMFHVEQ